VSTDRDRKRSSRSSRARLAIGLGVGAGLLLLISVGELTIRWANPADNVVVARGPSYLVRTGLTLAPVAPPRPAWLTYGEAAGARVVDVKPDSAAAASGLTPGDVIVSLDGHPVVTPAGIEEMLVNAAQAGRTAIPLLAVRAGKVYYAVLPLHN
jgi:S1-C subfamily serine protease